jgi:hypothetical protein
VAPAAWPRCLAPVPGPGAWPRCLSAPCHTPTALLARCDVRARLPSFGGRREAREDEWAPASFGKHRPLRGGPCEAGGGDGRRLPYLASAGCSSVTRQSETRLCTSLAMLYLPHHQATSSGHVVKPPHQATSSGHVVKPRRHVCPVAAFVRSRHVTSGQVKSGVGRTRSPPSCRRHSRCMRSRSRARSRRRR